jgi:hypothetical protein
VLSSPCHTPPAIVHALPALTCAPPPSSYSPTPCCAPPSIICAPQAALWLLLPLPPLPPHICAPSCPATDAAAADAAATVAAALRLFLCYRLMYVHPLTADAAATVAVAALALHIPLPLSPLHICVASLLLALCSPPFCLGHRWDMVQAWQHPYIP